MSQYSEKFRAQMVRKMAGPPAVTAFALSQDVGVCQTTLSRWFRAASKVGPMSKTKKSGARRPQDWSAAEKMAAVMEASALSEEDLGAFLRQRGLHQPQLKQWNAQMLKGLEPAPRKKTSPEARRLRALEREVLRKDKALAEASALLILKKKAEAIWGAVDDDTEPRSGK